RLQGRFQRLTRQLAQAELRTRIATEDSLRTAGVAEARAPSPNVVAVYPFTFLGGNRQFESLGRGLAELISADLVHLPGITVIERARMQDLLAELNLSNEEFMDPSSTPRVGRLLTAGRIVGGGFSVPGDQVQLDAAIMNASPNTVQDLGTRTDDLNRLFELQDELVFAIADSLNIDLTPQQREQISFIPTGNLEAFLAFSRGLEREDAGDFSGAASLYQQAAQLDPAFTQASSGQVRAQNTAQVPEGTGAALSDAFSLEIPLSPTIDPVADRIEQLNGVLDLTVVPSDDTREPAAESVPVELPLPPNPPGRPPGGN
ncbi:MAG: CsgG/HfaB family protein, partial [Bacteroidota bacterium]